MVNAYIAYENVANMGRHFAPIEMLAIMELEVDCTRGIELLSGSICIHGCLHILVCCCFHKGISVSIDVNFFSVAEFLPTYVN